MVSDYVEAQILVKPTAAAGLLNTVSDALERSCLMLASWHGLVNVVKSLLLAGARPGQVDTHGRTSLMMAIQPNVIKHQTVSCDGCNLSPLVGKRFKCTICADFDLCETCFRDGEHGEEGHTFGLIEQEGCPCKTIESRERWCAHAGTNDAVTREDLAEILIAPTRKAGAIDLQDRDGQTCLMMASERGLVRVVHQLLEALARVDLVDEVRVC